MTFSKHLIQSVGSSSSSDDLTLDKPDNWKILSIFSRLLNQSIYVADFRRGEFLYVSDHPLFLCGHSAEEVKEMGFSYYEKIILEKDMPIVMAINETGFRFFNEKPAKEWKDNVFLSLDFRIKQPGGKNIMVTQRLVPLELTNDYRMAIALCFVIRSYASQPGNAVIQNLDEPVQYRYNPNTHRFDLKDNNLLTSRETEVLFLSTKGDTNSEIAEKLKLSLSTIKQHKGNIFRKLGVNNTSEAVFYAITNRLV